MSWETFLEISTHTDCTKTPAYLPSRMLLILEEKVSLEIISGRCIQTSYSTVNFDYLNKYSK